ncbi:hypothetical protein K438DRAFT_1270756 [Mycena galopus ATCC 62051]|nr:hypothetical protein K438DRAFT_1270756 [Mycena galopus ATCC 62051]
MPLSPPIIPRISLISAFLLTSSLFSSRNYIESNFTDCRSFGVFNAKPPRPFSPTTGTGPCEEYMLTARSQVIFGRALIRTRSASTIVKQPHTAGFYNANCNGSTYTPATPMSPIKRERE